MMTPGWAGWNRFCCMNAALPTSIDCRPSVVRGILAPWDQVEGDRADQRAGAELANAPMIFRGTRHSASPLSGSKGWATAWSLQVCQTLAGRATGTGVHASSASRKTPKWVECRR